MRQILKALFKLFLKTILKIIFHFYKTHKIKYIFYILGIFYIYLSKKIYI